MSTRPVPSRASAFAPPASLRKVAAFLKRRGVETGCGYGFIGTQDVLFYAEIEDYNVSPPRPHYAFVFRVGSESRAVYLLNQRIIETKKFYVVSQEVGTMFKFTELYDWVGGTLEIKQECNIIKWIKRTNILDTYPLLLATTLFYKFRLPDKALLIFFANEEDREIAVEKISTSLGPGYQYTRMECDQYVLIIKALCGDVDSTLPRVVAALPDYTLEEV